MMSFSSAYAPSSSTVPPPSAPGISGILPGQQAVNTTRVLSLTGFSKDLKTRDIQAIFVNYEDDRGGYRIKWLDDTGCLIVFNDPIVAKRAFLNLTANPHPYLMPIINKEDESLSTYPKLVPYEGDDVPNVVASVATRPRSRSIAQNNGPATGGPAGVPAQATNGSNTHYRRMSNSSGAANARSFGRASMSQYQMQAIMDDASSAVAPTTPSKSSQTNGNSNPGSDATSPTASAKGSPPSTSGGAIDWGALQQQAAAQTSRARTGSASNASAAAAGTGSNTAGQAFSPPTSPERGIGLGQRAGAVSPSTLRRLVSTHRA